MQLFILGAASALITFVTAYPTVYHPLENQGQAFRVNQTVSKSNLLSGPATMARTYAKYAKYGAIAPKNVVSSSATGICLVVATPYYADTE